MSTPHDLISEKHTPETEADATTKNKLEERDIDFINETEGIEGSAVAVGDELTIFERKAALINASVC